MKVTLWGEQAAEEFIRRTTGVTVVDFGKILHKISESYPQIFIEVCTNPRLKHHILNDFETAYGTVAFVGGGMASEDIVQEDGMPVFIQDIKGPEKYQSGEFIKTYTKHFKKTNEVYVDYQKFLCLFDKSSKKIPYNQLTLFMSILELHKEDMNMPSIEESIRKAMEELGITDTMSGNTPEPDEEPIKETIKPKKQPKPKKETSNMGEPDEPEEDDTDSDEEMGHQMTIEELQQNTKPEPVSPSAVENIYCKIKDGKLALILPVGLVLERTQIAGADVDVLSVEVPDINVTTLQALKIFQKKPEPVKRVPIVSEEKPKPKKQAPQKSKPQVESTGDEDLDELLEEKQQLTNQIAEARAAGDEDLVNSLRKQRRVVRNKISQLKQ